jgi:hypothetical protein
MRRGQRIGQPADFRASLQRLGRGARHDHEYRPQHRPPPGRRQPPVGEQQEQAEQQRNGQDGQDARAPSDEPDAWQRSPGRGQAVQRVLFRQQGSRQR